MMSDNGFPLQSTNLKYFLFEKKTIIQNETTLINISKL